MTGKVPEAPVSSKLNVQIIAFALLNETACYELTGEELREVFADTTGARSFQGPIGAICERRYNSDFSREMSRSVRKVWESFKPQLRPAIGSVRSRG